jgi:hypothetical protein
MSDSPTERYVCVDPTKLEEINEILRSVNNREVAGSEEINMELFECASTAAILRFKIL